MKQSRGMVTSTFHGTVMASLLSVPLQSYPSGQKVHDFLLKAKLKNNTISDRKISNDLGKWVITEETKLSIQKMCTESRDILSSILK